MSDSPLDLEFKLLPAWMKEPADKNPYADYAGETESRGPRRDFGGRGPGRPGGQRPQSRGPQGSQNRGAQNRGPQGQQGGNRPSYGGGPRPQGGNREGNRPPRGDHRDSRDRRDDRAPQRPSGEITLPPREPSVPLQVEFIPEISGIAGLAKQIKSGHRAYPIYGLGRMFLNKPERHRVRIASGDPKHPIYQIGEDGPAFLNRQAAEREAFRVLRSEYYSEETVQLEAPKGNFKNVARCRLSGVLLGPTNYHGYQPALRRLYEARFSRRMDFGEFLRQIEVVSDPEVVEQWKQQSSSVGVYRTKQEAEPIEFKSVPEVEAHFRETYLPKVVKACNKVEISGLASREVSDRNIRDSIRNAWEKERGFPAQIVNHLRPHFLEAGLHIWKHRKRILFVSTVRPIRFGADSNNISEHIVNILEIIEATPKCTRGEISNRLLKPHEEEADFAKLKAAMASDLHWLIQSGHVIEFHDGILDLPLAPKDLAKETNEPEQSGDAPQSRGPQPKAQRPQTPKQPVQLAKSEAAAAPVATETAKVSEPVAEVQAREEPAEVAGEAEPVNVEAAPESESVPESAAISECRGPEVVAPAEAAPTEAAVDPAPESPEPKG